MVDVKINKKTYEGVESVQIPMADDSVLQEFVVGNRFNEILTYVGEYDVSQIEDETNAGIYHCVLDNAYADALAAWNASGMGAHAGGYCAFCVVPCTFDASQNDAIVVFGGFGHIENSNANWTYGQLCVYKNTYYNYVKLNNEGASNFAVPNDTCVQFLKRTTNSEFVVSATRAKLYLVTFPLA